MEIPLKYFVRGEISKALPSVFSNASQQALPGRKYNNVCKRQTAAQWRRWCWKEEKNRGKKKNGMARERMSHEIIIAFNDGGAAASHLLSKSRIDVTRLTRAKLRKTRPPWKLGYTGWCGIIITQRDWELFDSVLINCSTMLSYTCDDCHVEFVYTCVLIGRMFKFNPLPNGVTLKTHKSFIMD